ncbi:TPA: hypothetical protein ACXJW0_006261, partial [Pseudomonas aeruginosa]
MDALVMVLFVAAIAGGWWWLAKRMKASGRGWFVRHLLGSTAGTFAGLVVVSVALSLGIIEADQKSAPTPEQLADAVKLSHAMGVNPLPMQYKTVPEMIEDLGDYSAENGSFKLVSSSPLQFQIATTVAAGDLPENVQRELRRATLYGVFRTFVHTNAEAVKVKAVPNLMTTATTRAIQDKPNLEISVTREQALKAAQSLVPAERFTDLVLPERSGNFQLDNWTKPFEALYYKDDGQEALLKAIQAAGGDV